MTTHNANKKLLFWVVIFIAFFLSVNYVFVNFKTKKTPSTDIVSSTTGNLKDYTVDQSNLDKIKAVRDIDVTDHVLGSVVAPVKIIVYSDFECSFCAQFEDTLKQAKKDFGDQVVIAFRHFPLSDFHVNAMLAANVSECAAEQNKFWEMHDQLFADNKQGKFTSEQFRQDAVNLNLDMKGFDQCLVDEKYQEKIKAEIAAAKTFNVNGAPTTFVNGEMINGANPYEDLMTDDKQKLEGLKNIITRHLNDR